MTQRHKLYSLTETLHVYTLCLLRLDFLPREFPSDTVQIFLSLSNVNNL